MCRVFQKAKDDGGDGQDGDSASLPPAFAGSSHVEPPPEPDHSASSGSGGCYGYLPSQQQEVAVLPQYCYYGAGTGADHHYGFPRDDAAGALPGFGLGGGDGYGFGYFDMGGGFGDVASFGGGVEFPEVWDRMCDVVSSSDRIRYCLLG